MEPINGADTAWVLVSTALVMLMTPALGLFYGGLVRQKNALSTITDSFFVLVIVSVQWVLWSRTIEVVHSSTLGRTPVARGRPTGTRTAGVISAELLISGGLTGAR